MGYSYKNKNELPNAMLFFFKRIKIWISVKKRKGETSSEFKVTSLNYPYSWDIIKVVEKIFSKNGYTLKMDRYERKNVTNEFVYYFLLKKNI